MKKSVKIATHPETGAVITWNENPGKDGKTYGQLRLEQTSFDLEGSIIVKKSRSAFKTIEKSVADLIGFGAGQELPGQIVRIESFSPMFEGQAHKINPTSKEDVLVDGRKVYFQDTYTEDLTKKDSLIQASVSAPKVAPVSNIEAAVN